MLRRAIREVSSDAGPVDSAKWWVGWASHFWGLVMTDASLYVEAEEEQRIRQTTLLYSPLSIPPYVLNRCRPGLQKMALQSW